MNQLVAQNQKAMSQAAIDNQPYRRAYVEYQNTCPYCDKSLRLDTKRWPVYECDCSYWAVSMSGMGYKRQLKEMK